MATPLASPAAVDEKSPRTPRISGSNPEGILNFGTPTKEVKKINKPRSRYETPGSVVDKSQFNANPDVLKELLPYLAMGWAPERTAGTGDLCAIYALSRGYKNVMGLADIPPPAWVGFNNLKKEIRSDAFDKYHGDAMRRQLESEIPLIDTEGMDPQTIRAITAEREARIDNLVNSAMAEADFGGDRFYSIEEISLFVRFLNQKYKFGYRIGVISTQEGAVPSAYIVESTDPLTELHYPVIWLHNDNNYHWESVGPDPESAGLRARSSWPLSEQIVTVMNNGLHVVVEDAMGVDAEYTLTAMADQWVYEVPPPRGLQPREGYIYAHTTKGPNSDSWRVVGMDMHGTIRHQEGFIPFACLSGFSMYSISIGEGELLWMHKERGDDFMRPVTPPSLSQTEYHDTLAKQRHPPTSRPQTPPPRIPTTQPAQPPRPRLILSRKRPRVPPGRPKSITGPEFAAKRNLKNDWHTVRYLRMFFADQPDADDSTGQRFGAYDLPYSQGDILLALDMTYEEDEPGPVRVRSQSEVEGWAHSANLREIHEPFGLNNDNSVAQTSLQPDEAFREDMYPLSDLINMCIAKRLSPDGPRDALIARLLAERQQCGVHLVLYRVVHAVGPFVADDLVRVPGYNEMQDPGREFAAFGLEPHKRGVVAGGDLVEEFRTWGVRVKPHAHEIQLSKLVLPARVPRPQTGGDREPLFPSAGAEMSSSSLLGGVETPFGGNRGKRPMKTYARAAARGRMSAETERVTFGSARVAPYTRTSYPLPTRSEGSKRKNGDGGGGGDVARRRY